jgi:hypothetical protein
MNETMCMCVCVRAVYITFTMPPNATVPQYQLVNGNLSSAGYALDNIHFHWAFNDSLGSEHNIDGEPYVMEVGCLLAWLLSS